MIVTIRILIFFVAWMHSFCCTKCSMIHMESIVSNPIFTPFKRAPLSDLHDIIIAIKQFNLDVVESHAMNSSDPSSEVYGKFMTSHEIGKLTGNPVGTKFVLDRLEDVGISVIEQTPFGDYIFAQAPILVWNRFFATEFFLFRNEFDKSNILIRAHNYSLHVELVEHISAVLNTVQFPSSSEKTKFNIITQKKKFMSKLNKHRKLSSIYDGYVYPDLIDSYYGITNNVGNSLATQCVYSTGGQIFSPPDLTNFQQTFNVPVENYLSYVGGNVNSTYCYGPGNPPQFCDEANFDVQYLTATAQQIPTTIW